MENFPVEEFAKVTSFLVDGNTIKMHYRDETVTLRFESEGELFQFLRRWALYHQQHKGESAQPPPNGLLSPYTRVGVFV